MDKKLLFSFSIILMLLVFSGCSDQNDNSTKNENNIVGFWFGCEFGSSNNCSIFDDDGYEFTDSGEIYDVEETTQGSETECGYSPCFEENQKSITINRWLIGTYTYDGSSIIIDLPSMSSNWQVCNENIIWEGGNDFFENQSSCLPFESSYIKRYQGEVSIN